MDLLGFEPRAFCMRSRRDTTTPQARILMQRSGDAYSEQQMKKNFRAVVGIEPTTSPTLRENHTTRPNRQYDLQIPKTRP